MELATMVVETAKLSDNAQRALNAGHPDEAKEHLLGLYLILLEHLASDAPKETPTPETSPPSTPPQDGDAD